MTSRSHRMQIWDPSFAGYGHPYIPRPALQSHTSQSNSSVIEYLVLTHFFTKKKIMVPFSNWNPQLSQLKSVGLHLTFFISQFVPKSIWIFVDSILAFLLSAFVLASTLNILMIQRICNVRVIRVLGDSDACMLCIGPMSTEQCFTSGKSLSLFRH